MSDPTPSSRSTWLGCGILTLTIVIGFVVGLVVGLHF